jgi:large subunit ribosomal protein L7/L12
MALTVETFVKEIESMSVLELNNLVKALEEKFGVSAAMMAAPAAAAAGGAPAAAAAEEQTEFTVVLKDAGSHKINVIKVVREVNSSLGLKEAKDLVENLGTIKEGVSKDEAGSIKKKFEDAGAARRRTPPPPITSSRHFARSIPPPALDVETPAAVRTRPT